MPAGDRRRTHSDGRAVIDSTVCRTAGFGPFGEDEHRACDALVKLVSPMFRVPSPEQ